MSLITILFVFMSFSSLASVTVGHVDCPIQFEGRVHQVIKGVGPSSAFATQTVIFQNNRTLKGEVKSQVSVEILENGPIQVEEGKDYSVQLRSGRVCQIESL